MKNFLLIVFLLFSWVLNAAQYPVSLGGGGLPKWEPTVSYKVDEIVWEPTSLKFFKAIDAHVSSATFPPDLVAHWEELSDNLNRELDTTVTDNKIVRWDGTDGDNVEDSLVGIDDSGEVTGATKLTVDNISIDSNTITAIDVNGDLHLTGNGTGKVVIDGDLQVDGTTTTVNSTVLDVAASKITVNVGGNQASADSGSALEVQMTDATDAKIKYDSTTTSKFSVGELGSEKEIVTVSDIQTITNKELGNTASINVNLAMDIVSTSKGARPCPSMTEAQRDLLTGVLGGCIYNLDQKKLNIFDGSTWLSAGGGLEAWKPTFAYKIGDTVHEADKIYRSVADHTSSALFVTDVANWVEMSDDLNREVALSVTDNGIVRWDTDQGDDVQNSLVIIDDLGNITGVNNLTIGGETLLDILDLGHVTTPTSPAAGRDKLYFKNDDKLYKLDNLGVESLVGLNLTSVTDNMLIKSDGVGGDSIQESGIEVTDTDTLNNVNEINALTFGLANSTFTTSAGAKINTQTSVAPFDKFFGLSHKTGFDFGSDGAVLYGYGDNHITGVGRISMATNAKDINFITQGDSDNPLAKIEGLTGTFKEETPTDGNYKPVGEKYKGEENYFLRGQSDYGLMADWTGSLLTQDTTSTNLLTGEFSVWKWTDTATIGNVLYSPVIDIPRGMRQAEIGYQFRYKYDGNDSDIDLLVQCVDDSSFLVSDGQHKLQKYVATDGSAFATGEFAPSGCAQVKLIFKVAISNSGKELFFDSMKVTPFNPTIKKLTESGHLQIEQNASVMLDRTGEFRYNLATAVILNESKLFMIEDDASNTRTKVVALKNLDNVVVSFTGHTNTSNGVPVIYKNGVIVYRGATQPTTLQALAISYSTSMIAGEFLTFAASGGLRNVGAPVTTSITATADTDTLVRNTNPNEVDSMIRYVTGNGVGSVADRTRRFANYTTDSKVAFQSAVNQTVITAAIKCVDDSVQALECEILEDGTYTINYSDTQSSGAGFIGIVADSTTIGAPVSAHAEVEQLAISYSSSAGVYILSSWTGRLKKGQLIRPQTDSGNMLNSRSRFTISKTKTSAHVSIPIDDLYQNHFSARIQNNGTASIISDDGSGFIQSVARTSVGRVVVTFKSGFFSTIPTLIANTEATGSDASVSSISVSSAEILTYDGGVASDLTFGLTADRQDSDVKLKTGIVTGPFADTRTCIIEDRKSSGANGGSSIASSINVRVLNTSNGDCEFLSLINGTTGVSGTANRFTLSEGKYIINCRSPVFAVNQNQAMLYNVTDNLYTSYGSSVSTPANTGGQSVTSDLVTISDTKTFSLRHYTLTSKAGDGLGNNTHTEGGNPATYNTFSQCKIQKVR